MACRVLNVGVPMKPTTEVAQRRAWRVCGLLASVESAESRANVGIVMGMGAVETLSAENNVAASGSDVKIMRTRARCAAIDAGRVRQETRVAQGPASDHATEHAVVQHRQTTHSAFQHHGRGFLGRRIGRDECEWRVNERSNRSIAVVAREIAQAHEPNQLPVVDHQHVVLVRRQCRIACLVDTRRQPDDECRVRGNTLDGYHNEHQARAVPEPGSRFRTRFDNLRGRRATHVALCRTPTRARG